MSRNPRLYPGGKSGKKALALGGAGRKSDLTYIMMPK